MFVSYWDSRREAAAVRLPCGVVLPPGVHVRSSHWMRFVQMEPAATPGKRLFLKYECSLNNSIE